MKSLRIIVTLLVVCMLVACINETTTIGNPPPMPLPEPVDVGGDDIGGNDKVTVDLAAFTKAYIESNPSWEGDGYLVEFEPENELFYVIMPDKTHYISWEYTIRSSDGYVVAEDDEGSDISLTGYPKEDLNALNMHLISSKGSIVANLKETDSDEGRAILSTLCVLDPDYLLCNPKEVEATVDNSPTGKYGFAYQHGKKLYDVNKNTLGKNHTDQDENNRPSRFSDN